MKLKNKSNFFTIFFSGKTVDGGVITLPSHFKVDDPESTIGYDANFGRRIPQNPPSIQQVRSMCLKKIGPIHPLNTGCILGHFFHFVRDFVRTILA